MKNYTLKWMSGSFSAIPLTKEQVIKGINNWIDKTENWGYIEIKNNKTGSVEVISQDEMMGHISDITV